MKSSILDGCSFYTFLTELSGCIASDFALPEGASDRLAIRCLNFFTFLFLTSYHICAFSLSLPLFFCSFSCRCSHTLQAL